MAPLTWAVLAARTLFFMSRRPLEDRASPEIYASNSVSAINTLQSTWYDSATGIWDNAWWNSGVILTTLADFAIENPSAASPLNIPGIISNTFAAAQGLSANAVKVITDGMVKSTYSLSKRAINYWDDVVSEGNPGFIDNYYDDEGWWAMALIRSYDLTQDQTYLDTAVSIFNDMETGTGTPCGGGIYWNKDRQYVNAIANELYLDVAASLANRIPGNSTYLSIAQAQWNWFKNSGMINSANTINDGLTSTCQNNGAETWTYNQGVILGGLVELSQATGDASLLTEAITIARAAIAAKTVSGVLVESCDPNCGSDGSQFKGIFVRNLRYLNAASPQSDFVDFFTTNADSVWANDRAANNTLGDKWNGPYSEAIAPSQGSALDALVAGMVVA